MRIFQNSSNKVIGLRVKMPATADNTAYTLRASPLPFGTLLPAVATSYMLETLSEMVIVESR